jgi:hypothetical protein
MLQNNTQLKLSKRRMTSMNAEKLGNNNTDFNFDIIRERLFTKGGQDTQMDAIVRADNGFPISVVSPRYKVTTHKEANEFVEKMLTKFDIEYEVGNTWMSKDSARFMRVIKFPKYKFIPQDMNNTALDGGRKNDEFVPTFIERNSFDRTTAYQLIYGGIRSVCSNGLILGDIVQNVVLKHNKEVDYDHLQQVFMTNIEQTVEGIKKVYTKLNAEPGNLLIKSLIMETLSERVLQSFLYQLPNGLVSVDFDENQKPLDVVTHEDVSAYLVYQIMTNVISHHVKQMNTQMMWHNKINKVFGLR